MKYWFKAKTFGYGWYPSTWQGGIVVSVYLVVLGAFVWWFVRNAKTFNVWLYLGGVLALTSILIFICYKKGEPARWRWGK